MNNKFYDNINLDISSVSPGVMRTKFTDPDQKRWDLNKVDGFMGNRDPDALTMLESLGFEQNTASDSFEFLLKDPVSDNVIFDTNKRSLIFSDKYIEIGMTLPTQVLFGLGQHNAKFLLTEGIWTMFNRDQPGSPVATGKGDEQLYGTHPFLMGKTTDNKFFGLLFYNSNAQQVKIRYSPSGKSLINYVTVGGVLDVYYFMPDSADNIIRKYNSLIGMPVLPPFWALGFQQSSWDYSSLQTLKDVVVNYTANGYMFDVIWADIHYMDKYIDFTVDDVNYKGLGDWVDQLHKQSIRLVPIIDAGISLNKSTAGDNWYEIGRDMDVFIKSTKNPTKKDGNLVGVVWPGYTSFVDFLSDKSFDFWKKGLDTLYTLVKFDGIWLDMNEPSNF